MIYFHGVSSFYNQCLRRPPYGQILDPPLATGGRQPPRREPCCRRECSAAATHQGSVAFPALGTANKDNEAWADAGATRSQQSPGCAPRCRRGCAAAGLDRDLYRAPSPSTSPPPPSFSRPHIRNDVAFVFCPDLPALVAYNL